MNSVWYGLSALVLRPSSFMKRVLPATNYGWSVYKEPWEQRQPATLTLKYFVSGTRKLTYSILLSGGSCLALLHTTNLIITRYLFAEMSYIPQRFPRYNGYSLPPFDPLIKNVKGQLDMIKNFESRKSDILICTYVKSGTNWLNEIINMMVKGKAEYSDQYKLSAMLEKIPDFTQLENMPETSTRVINTHVLFQDLPQKHIQNGCKVVHMYRNPKSVAVSWYNHVLKIKRYRENEINDYPKDWPYYIDNFSRCPDEMYSGWFNYEKEMERAKEKGMLRNVFTMQYEELKRNPLPVLKDLAMFLEVSLLDGVVEEICEKSSFEQMSTLGEKVKDNTNIKADSVDGTNPYFRKGTIDDWKNWFTVAQDEAFTQLIEIEMKDSNLKLIYE